MKRQSNHTKRQKLAVTKGQKKKKAVYMYIYVYQKDKSACLCLKSTLKQQLKQKLKLKQRETAFGEEKNREKVLSVKLCNWINL